MNRITRVAAACALSFADAVAAASPATTTGTTTNGPAQEQQGKAATMTSIVPCPFTDQLCDSCKAWGRELRVKDMYCDVYKLLAKILELPDDANEGGPKHGPYLSEQDRALSARLNTATKNNNRRFFCYGTTSKLLCGTMTRVKLPECVELHKRVPRLPECVEAVEGVQGFPSHKNPEVKVQRTAEERSAQ